MDRLNNRASDVENTLWIQTTLYDLVEATGAVLGAGEEHLITNVLLDLGNTRRLRPSERWARIKFVSPVETVTAVARGIA